MRIRRDANGVPHVRAATPADLLRGLGYCHARDRGMQMLLTRIFAEGRACEQLRDSEDMLQLDRFFRRIHLRADLDAEVAKLDPPVEAALRSYCDGANAAFREGLPWELALLGYRFEPWSIADSILVLRASGYVALAQSQGDMERLLLEMVQAGVPTEQLEALFPGLLEGLDRELLERIQLGERIVPPAVRWNPALPRALASNNWALAGHRTRSGRAMLANDPHLEGNRLPAIWYEAVLELPERYCISASMPGLPGASLGRTPDLAWGATYTFMDAIDSWIEDCRNGCYRRLVGGEERWERFRTRVEVVRRRRHPDARLTFHENDHGVLDGAPDPPGLRLTTRWASARGTGAQTFNATLLGMLFATDVREGMELLGQVETSWNWVLADRAGHIAYQMSGLLPRRRPGWTGFLPLPGWDPENDWLGFADPTELPRCLDPPCGYLVTANDDLNALGRTRPINLPMGAYRAERIRELLASRDDWTLADLQSLQLDVFSPQAERFMQILRPLLPEGEHGAALRDWDLAYESDSQGALLFERCYADLLREVFGSVCGSEVLRFLGGETGILADFYANFDAVLLDAESPWYAREPRDVVFRRVAARALAAPARPLRDRRQLVMDHLLLRGRLWRWLGFGVGPLAVRGSRATIHQGQVYRLGGRQTSFVPSFRLVTDFAEPAAHTCLAGGPSDRRFSRWYTHGVEDWHAGRYKELRPDGATRHPPLST